MLLKTLFFLLLTFQSFHTLSSDISELTEVSDDDSSSNNVYSPTKCTSCISKFRSQQYIIQLCSNETVCIESFYKSKKHFGTCLAMNYCFPNNNGWKVVCVCGCMNENYYENNTVYHQLIDCFLSSECGGVGGCGGIITVNENCQYFLQMLISSYLLLFLLLLL